VRDNASIANELERIAKAPTAHPAWAIREVMNEAANALTSASIVRTSDLTGAARVLSRGSSSLGDYREALKALVGWAE
jgi:hypothetical protein